MTFLSQNNTHYKSYKHCIIWNLKVWVYTDASWVTKQWFSQFLSLRTCLTENEIYPDPLPYNFELPTFLQDLQIIFIMKKIALPQAQYILFLKTSKIVLGQGCM